VQCELYPDRLVVTAPVAGGDEVAALLGGEADVDDRPEATPLVERPRLLGAELLDPTDLPLDARRHARHARDPLHRAGFVGDGVGAVAADGDVASLRRGATS
jgi:hypothetical protein